MVTAYPQLPQTSSAVNIQIIEPKNFPGGAVPGQIGSPAPYGVPSASPAVPQTPQTYGPTPASAGSAYPSNYNNMFPSMNPQQALQNAYTEALNAKNMAEQARNSYLNLANQMNSAAFQQQLPFYQQQQTAPNPFQTQAGPWGQPVAYPYPGQFPGQYPGQYPDPYAAYPQPTQEAFPQQPELPPEQVQQQPQPSVDQPQAQAGLKSANVEQLNAMIDQPTTLQERMDAMEEIGGRGYGTAKTYDLLKREALADTSHLQGQAKDDADYVRQAALWTLGMLNASQNASVPTKNLPGLDVLKQVIQDEKENKDVRAAAIQAWQVINRQDDKDMKNILKDVAGKGWFNFFSKPDPDLKRLAEEALAGKTIPLPSGPALGLA